MMRMKRKEFQKNIKKFGKVLKKKFERLMVAKKMNEPIKLRLLRIIIRSVFSENGKLYPQLLLDEALYE